MKKPKKVVRKRKVAVVKKEKSSTHQVIIKVENHTLSPKVAEQALAPIMERSKLRIPTTWISDKQLIQMVQKTPKEHVFTRAAKGGGIWEYVTGTYVEKVLNFTFGWNWDLEIVHMEEKYKQVISRVKLTVKDDNGHSISKMQIGRSDIKYKKNSNEPLDYGNDEKAAVTDGLKKCASLFGIASDIYGKAEFKDVGITIKLDAPTTLPTTELHDCHGWMKGGCPEGNQVTKAEADISIPLYKKPLCRNCFNEMKNVKK